MSFDETLKPGVHVPAPVQVVEFDARVPQAFTFEITDDSGTSRVSHEFKPLVELEETILAYDAEREITYQTKGKDTEINPATAGATINFWNRSSLSVDGYGAEGEQLP